MMSMLPLDAAFISCWMLPLATSEELDLVGVADSASVYLLVVLPSDRRAGEIRLYPPREHLLQLLLCLNEDSSASVMKWREIYPAKISWNLENRNSTRNPQVR